MQYSDTTIWEILKFICATADLSAVIGYDMRVGWDGNFEFFSLSSIAESYSLQDECQFNRYLKDSTRVRNKIKVKGKADKPYPRTTDGNNYDDVWSDYVTPANVTELTANAAASQAVIEVTSGDGANFSADDYIWITDDDVSVSWGELKQIDSISTGTGGGGNDEITVKTNLARAYTTANFAILWEVSTTSRWGWAPQASATEAVIRSESTTKVQGSYSVEFECTNAMQDYQIMMPLLSTEHFSMDEYPTIKARFFVDTTKPDYLLVRVLSNDAGVNDYAVSNPINVTKLEKWMDIEVTGGADNAASWIVGDTHDWTDISVIIIEAYFAANTATKVYIDRLHAFGKRWGGGTDDATVDGFASDANSIVTYGTRELVYISDLLLSDAECEAKAQALKTYYKDERITIELSSDTLDWTVYHPSAGSTIAADLDLLGVTGSTYRIDSIDIIYRAMDNSLMAVFSLDKTPKRVADYLYNISERLRQLERDYKTVR